jgi:hypothetical protein
MPDLLPTEPPAADLPPAPEPPAADPAPEPDTGTESAETAKWKALARKHEATAKANSDAAKRLKVIEDQAKSEADKATDRATEAETKIKAMTARVVRAEVKALAGQTFADPDDAAAFLDLASYVDEDGEVDAAAITKDLAALLKRKPHLAAGHKVPVDLGQGSRGDGPSIDQQIREAQKAGNWQAVIALENQRHLTKS